MTTLLAMWEPENVPLMRAEVLQITKGPSVNTCHLGPVCTTTCRYGLASPLIQGMGVR